MSAQQEERRKWHVNREVSVGDLVAIVGAIVAVLVSYFSLDKRVAVVEQALTQQRSEMGANIQEIKTDVRRLADRIERVLDTK